MLLILGVFLLDGFLLLLVLVVLVSLVVRADILDLRLILLFLLISFLLLLVSLVIADLLASLLLDQESDGVADELRVLLDNLLDLLLLEELSLVLLHVEDDLGASAHGLASVGSDGEGSSSRRLPDVLLVIIVLGVDSDLVSHKVGGVETHTELSDHGDVSSSGESLHESLGAGLGDCSKVVDHVSLGHTNTSVDEGEGLGVDIRDDLDVKLLLSLELAGIGEGLIPDLVQSIGRV